MVSPLKTHLRPEGRAARRKAFGAVEQVWRENRLAEETIQKYRCWVRHFLHYCEAERLDPKVELTRAGVERFARRFSRARQIKVRCAIKKARVALGTWAQALNILGERLPPWQPPEDRPSDKRLSLLDEFAEYLKEHRGLAPRTIMLRLQAGELLLESLRSRRRTLGQIQLSDLDALVADRRQHWALSTVVRLCVGFRQFLRFLHVSGRLRKNLAHCVMAPTVRAGNRPPRSLPWEDVQRILRAIDRATPTGRRDYILLLIMSTYGCGAGELIGLQLQDIDWPAATLHLMRPKTGVKIDLPLLPAVARALADYLRHGRPVHAPTRAVFVDMHSPHRPHPSSAAVRPRSASLRCTRRRQGSLLG